MQLTSLQQKAVNQILALYNPTEKVVCEFKSPTGSGKTLMASAFISNLIERNAGDRFVFVIATPSSSSLPYFFEQKINKYKADLPYSKFEVEYIQSPSAAKNDTTENIRKILPQQNKVYIFGKSSFGKGRILQEYGIIGDFVKYSAEQGYKLIYIRDEAHIGGEKADNSEQANNFEALMAKAAAFVLKMTATPDYRNPLTKKVTMSEKDLNDERLNEGKWLLKTTPLPILDKSMDDTQVLHEAIEKFGKIKADYATLGIGINPAMLIQVDNSSTTNKEKKASFEAALGQIKKELSAAGLAWVQYFGDGDKDSNRVYKNDFSLDDITRNQNDIDAVIFKIGPATGWDIPRACMLVQLRNVSSANLSTQTLGRIKRNPFPNLEKNEITDKYYVLSNVKDNDSDAKTYYYTVREKFAAESFLKIEITNAQELKKGKKSNNEFRKAFGEWLEAHKKELKQEISTSFPDGKTYRKVVMLTDNGKQITSTVSNAFIFLRDYKRLVSANRFLYENIQGEVEKFARKENIQTQFIFVVLMDSHKNDIRGLFNKTRTFKPRYEIKESVYDPKDYTEIYNEKTVEEKVPKRDYLFSINDTSLDGNRQPLDSEPEKIVFNKIYDFAEEYDGIQLWAKNQTTSNIYGDYLDNDNNLRKSYFDFIIKFQNGFYLYLEVKGKHDIDAEKTELLEKAYESYFAFGDKNLFSQKLAIAVCRVDTNGEIAVAPFYDRAEIAEPLDEKSFDEMFKFLSSKSLR